MNDNGAESHPGKFNDAIVSLESNQLCPMVATTTVQMSENVGYNGEMDEPLIGSSDHKPKVQFQEMETRNTAAPHVDINLPVEQNDNRNTHDAIPIFNKFDAVGSQDKLEVRSTFGYEKDNAVECTSNSDGEVQSTRQGRRKKLVPPITVLTHSSAK